VLAALRTLLSGPADKAATALLLPPGVAAAALAVNARVESSPTVSALERYAGTVYDGLDLASMDEAARRAAARSVHVFSGLFGVVRGDELVPDYRVPAKASLPGVGVVGTSWRPVLDEVLPATLARGVIVDLRSSDYAAMWRPRGWLAERTITVRVLSPLPAGGLGVVSYASKFAKGRLVRALAQANAAGTAVDSVEDVAALWLAATGHATEVMGKGALTIHHPAKVVGNPDA
jgi:hypothetical protein